jgi:prepilin-type processing-associated H-X9-DG protein
VPAGSGTIDGVYGCYNTPLGKSDGVIKVPAETVCFADSSCYVVSEAPAWPLQFTCRIAFPHNSGINIAWCDGHAKWAGKTSAQVTRHRYWTVEED